MKKLLLVIAVIALAAFFAWREFAQAPIARTVADDGGTRWRPAGNPTVGAFNAHIATPITFRTMHVGPNNTDQLWIATAPEQELAWVAEQQLYIPEGPTMDDRGQIYFSPLYPPEDVSLVVLDPDTGKRLWSLPHKGDNKGAGRPWSGPPGYTAAVPPPWTHPARPVRKRSTTPPSTGPGRSRLMARSCGTDRLACSMPAPMYPMPGA